MEIMQRDYSIDFIKGIAILSVIFLHNTPHHYLFSIAWIGQAVPLFLLVTAYLTYVGFEKKSVDVYFSKKSVKKMANRIFLPFMIVTLIQCMIYFSFKSNIAIKSIIASGGIGPGSYYPWLYLQCWIMLPFIIKIVDSISIRKSFILFLVICILLEFMSCSINISGFLYRLLFYRYLFLLYLGCLIKKLYLKIDMKLTILAAISLIFMMIVEYEHLNLEPFFINQWAVYHWVTEFYPLLIFLFLVQLYRKMQDTIITKFFIILGTYSYEIFLCQMFVFSMISKKRLAFIGNVYMELILYILLTTILSIVPILVYKLYLRKKIFPRFA
ncbi:hypothetical protein EZS27_031368 [termite gut metagenome]|uniref:Acyltransferase 3 domain-containing protein n=1 Tax=termite gut metagenome TaxID=433724 RepID=A0A5J4QC97_9ZZZZ